MVMSAGASSRPSARLQDQLTQGLALLAVNEPGGRFVRIEQIVVCPLGEGDQHRLQGTALSVRTYSCQALPSEAGCRRRMPSSTSIFSRPASMFFGDTEVFLEFAKTAHPAQSIADDQQRPPVADNVEGAAIGQQLFSRRVRFTKASRLIVSL
ncbi:Uncharacterised protein [Klebsiella pneumoniae]|uniref:Uncharacterized protein n=1 Tax=Klebsiella pneumoniae TaxID=573 RepID=A0A377XBY2_KLEPN|nr:Uncharacterised protein [Klebsiella pneumoniae]